jgi:hypothetical protein
VDPAIKQKKLCFSLFLIVALFCVNEAKPQEYRHETGGTLGTSFYLGDANRTRLYLHPGFSGGMIYRYNLNFHWAIKANLVAGQVSGNSADAANVFPFEQQLSFVRSFIDLGGQLEFNFLPFSDKFSYKGAKPYTPYIFTGAGTTLAMSGEPFFYAHIPVGIGFKYKIQERLNVGLEFSFRKLFGDDFEMPENSAGRSLDAPYGIKSSILKNQDGYSLTMVFLTWDFEIRKDPCCE